MKRRNALFFREIPRRLHPFFVLIFLGCLIFLGAGSRPCRAEEPASNEKIKVNVAVLAEFPPLYIQGPGRKPTGFAIDILHLVSQNTNLQIKYLVVENWAQALQAVRSGKADLIPGCGITKARQVEFAYTESIETVPICIFVRSEDYTVKGLQDLLGKRVAVLQKTAPHTFLSSKKGIKLVIIPNIETALMQLLAGEVEAFVFSKPAIEIIARKVGLAGRIKVAGDPLFELKRGYLVRQDEKKLLALLSPAITALTESSDYLTVYRKWYGEPEPFWTVSKVAWSMGSGGVLLFILIIAWRYKSLAMLSDKYRTVADFTYDWEIWRDENGELRYTSPSCERITGYGFDEFTNDPELLLKIVHPDDSKAVLDHYKACNAHETDVAAMEFRIRTRDGKVRWIGHTCHTVYDRGGKRRGRRICNRDITDRKIAESTLRENEKLLKTINANLPGVTFQLIPLSDGKDQLSYVSPKYKEILGFHVSLEKILETFISCLPTEDVAEFKKTAKKAIKQRSAWSYEGRFIKPDNQIIWIECRATPLEIENKLTFHGFLIDSTEKHRMIEELHKTKFLFDRATLAIYLIGETGRIFEVNDQAVLQTGYSKQELTGMSVSDLDPSVTEDVWIYLWQQLSQKGSDVSESTQLRKNGTEFPVLISAQYLEYDGQQYSAVFIQDITNLKQAEEETKHLESVLAQSQKMEAIGTLAGGIAHDFNNILFAVTGYSELALGEVEPGSQVHTLLEQILTAGIRATDLVSRILTFSRRNETELRPLQAGPLVKEALKLLRSSLPSTIEFFTQIDSGLENIRADPTQIHQIVMNLCTNAAHAMEDGGGTLSVTLTQVTLTESDIRLHPGLRASDYLKLVIQDTGRGISKEVIERIYDPYFTTKQEGKGTGLGLAVVHGIVTAYGGSICAYSEPGKGAAFNVYLPTIKEEALAEREAAISLQTGTEHILLVDDEPDLVDIVERILTRLGYRVTTASGSLEALDIFQKSYDEIDLVLTDLTMPKMTGDRLAMELMKINPLIPVVITTGCGLNLTDENIAAIGIKAVIPKPVPEAELAGAIRGILDAE